jgi:cbb3-type cytochrome oxidase subunit 3
MIALIHPSDAVLVAVLVVVLIALIWWMFMQIQD